MFRGKLKLIALLLAFSLLGSGTIIARQFFRFQEPENQEIKTGDDTPSETGGSFNILLLGTDARPGEKIGNTDTIIVAHFEGNRLALLSIPRDSRVFIPNHGMDKINAAYSYGGPMLTARLVSDLIGTSVTEYALIRWNGFINIIDMLGGVTVNIKQDMYYYDPVDGPEYKIALHKGIQHLNGHQALAFARFREEALGDIDRTGQQQELLKALVQQVMQPATLLKLPRLLPEIYRDVETNMSLDELLAIAKTAANLKNITVVSQTLPGYFLNLNGISYWGVNPDQARQVAQELFSYGKTTNEIVLNTPIQPNIAGRRSATSSNKSVSAESQVTPKASLKEVKPAVPKTGQEAANNQQVKTTAQHSPNIWQQTTGDAQASAKATAAGAKSNNRTTQDSNQTTPAGTQVSKAARSN
ncbi:MAG: LCP family protein [Moorella sp. (in: firmicutes)]